MKHFKLEEFNCRCCAQNKMQQSFLNKLDDIREKVGLPFHVTSGFRCEKHNQEVGGKPNSQHLLGIAADVSLEFFPAINKHYLIKLAPQYFNGIGIAKTFIHLDTRETPSLWVY